MHLPALLIGTMAVMARHTLAEPWKHFDCGTDQGGASKEFMEAMTSLTSNQNGGSLASRASEMLVPRDAIKVPTFFHVVSTKAKDGSITQAMADNQIATLNKAYKPANVQFELKGTDFTVNDKWAVGEEADDTEMKQKLRKGTYGSLNIYFQTDLTGSVLGKCTLPAALGSGGGGDTAAYADDGCNVNANTMPGGTATAYNSGMTAVHETGHWMGLLHVFEGYACEGDGDFIEDTPVQSESTDGCPKDNPAKDSCPNQKGVDAIHNYMDYSTDACYEGFSQGQIARMANMWGMYRKGN